jgi:iron complex transport system substrate-binding protein
MGFFMFGTNLRLIAAVALIAMMVAVTASCRKMNPLSADENSTRIVTDDFGRSMEIPKRITRAVSLAPNLTESIFAVGGGDRLVGVTTYCNYPVEATRIEKVGDTINPNIEKILALRPEIVFVSTASQVETFTKTLEEQGVKVFITSPKNFEAVLMNLQQLGDIFDTPELTTILLNELQTRIVSVDEEVRDRTKARVFVQISKSPLFTVGKDSFLGELVSRAGGELATAGIIDKPFAQISGETAMALNPDVIVLSDSEDNREPNEVFKNSKAVKNGRIIRLDADIISRPSPRIVTALEQLSEALAANAGNAGAPTSRRQIPVS